MPEKSKLVKELKKELKQFQDLKTLLTDLNNASRADKLPVQISAEQEKEINTSSLHLIDVCMKSIQSIESQLDDLN